MNDLRRFQLSIENLKYLAKSDKYLKSTSANISFRCAAQLKFLLSGKLSSVNSKIASNLTHLYSDTIESTNFIASTTYGIVAGNVAVSARQEEIRRYFENLELRHATVIESFSEFLHCTHGSGISNVSIESFIRTQLSISTLLQHGVFLTSRKFLREFGCVSVETKVLDMCVDAKEHATLLAEHNYTFSPDISIYGDAEWCIDVVPSLVHFVLVELLKNALYSTILKCMQNPNSNHNYDLALNHVEIFISHTKEETRIMIKDRGVGFVEDCNFQQNIRRFLWKRQFTSR